MTNEDSCRVTNDKGPQKNKPCIFPFLHQGQIYNKCGCILRLNKTHEQECKNQKHPRARFWCSTKVNDKGEHILGGNNYGFCDRNCMLQNKHTSKLSIYSENKSDTLDSKSIPSESSYIPSISNASDSCVVTNEKGPQKNKPCVFPFLHQGVLYNECGCILRINKTYTEACRNKNHPRARFWCSTKVDEKGQHISGAKNYGFCNRKCFVKDIELSSNPKNSGFEVTGFMKGYERDSEKTQTKSMERNESAIANSEILAVTNRSTISDAIKFRDNMEMIPTISAATLSKPSASPPPIQSFDLVSNTNLRKEADITESFSINNNNDGNSGTWLPNANDLECGQTTNTGYLIGGSNTRLGEFPYVAALGFSPTGNDSRTFFVCGGTLINRRYVVTAAHCLSPGIPGLALSRVVLGLVDLSKFEKPHLYLENEEPQSFYVTESDVTIHDKYAPEAISGKVIDIMISRIVF